MFNFTVQIFQDDKLKDINFSQYLKNKTVIICPKIKIAQKPTLQYFEYLDSLLDSHRLDEIIVIGSTDEKFFHHIVKSYFPRFTTINDTSQTYISNLKESKGKTQDLEVLVQQWTYQQALHDCSELGFWEQPLSDKWKHLLANRRAIKQLMQSGGTQRKIIQKLYKGRHTINPWAMEDVTALSGSQAAIGGGVANEEGFMLGASMFGMGADFFYFNLMSNKELESTLEVVNNRSGKTL